MTFFYRCKDCGNYLTDEIKFDLGWHCDYPCDSVTYFEDVDPMKNFDATDEAHFVELYLTSEIPFTIWVPDNFDYAKMHKIALERGFFFVKTNIDGEEGFICQKLNSDRVSDSKN